MPHRTCALESDGVGKGTRMLDGSENVAGLEAISSGKAVLLALMLWIRNETRSDERCIWCADLEGVEGERSDGRTL